MASSRVVACAARMTSQDIFRVKLHCYLLIARVGHGRDVGRLGRQVGCTVGRVHTVVAVRLCVGQARGSGHDTRLVVTKVLPVESVGQRSAYLPSTLCSRSRIMQPTDAAKFKM